MADNFYYTRKVEKEISFLDSQFGSLHRNPFPNGKAEKLN